jgi:hypothetical protein
MLGSSIDWEIQGRTNPDGHGSQDDVRIHVWNCCSRSDQRQT